MRERLIGLILTLAVALGVSAAPAAAQAQYYQDVTFETANVITADESGTAISGFGDATLAGFYLTCTEDSGTATLDSAIQRRVGTAWVNIVAFTQLAATGSETKLYADVRAASAQMIGNTLRVNHDITGTGQYTCSVYGAFEA